MTVSMETQRIRSMCKCGGLNTDDKILCLGCDGDTMRAEAIKRLKTLGVMSSVIDDFKNKRLNRSERGGILFWADADAETMRAIAEVEKDGHMPYHVVKEGYTFGTCHSVLLVSKYVIDWDLDMDKLKEEYYGGVGRAFRVFSYVYNSDYHDCSEYGSIGIRLVHGGLERVW